MSRFGVMLLGWSAVVAVAAPAFIQPAPRLIWNASASVPVGLYRAVPGAPVRRGDLAAAAPPAGIDRLMAARGYLPLGVPMLKQVVALPGQKVCRLEGDIFVDGRRIGEARLRDRLGRPLPRWSGCRLLVRGELFLMNPGATDSFDGRYFGPVDARLVQARLQPLWVWRAPPALPEPVNSTQ